MTEIQNQQSPLHPFMTMVKRSADKLRMTTDDVAEASQIAPSFMRALMEGHRHPDSLPPTKLRALALFGGMTMVEAVIMVGWLRVDDLNDAHVKGVL